MDFAFGASATIVNDHEHSATYAGRTPSNFFGAGSGGSTDISSDVNFQTLDAELGRTMMTQPATEVRLFAGLRALHFSEDTEVSIIDNGSGVPNTPATRSQTEVDVESRFFGIGPRVGAEASHRIAQSAIGISGGLSAAVLFGILDEDTSASSVIISTQASNPVDPDFNPGSGGSSFEAVLNVEGNVALDLNLSDTSKVTVGYQGEYFHNVRHGNDIFESESENYLTHGPFARWTNKL